MIKNWIKTIVLLGALTALLLWAGNALGGRTGLTIALVIAFAMNFITYWFSDKIVLAIYRARKTTKHDMPKLHKIVEEAAKAAKIPKPKVYIVPTQTPNAFATGRNPKHAAIACTEGILNLLDEKELKGVIAHELAHVKNRDTLIMMIAVVIAGAISYLAMMARFAAIFGGGRDREGRGNIIGLLLFAILTPIIAMIIQLAISRSREYLADETGARMIKDPKSLASALHKLEMGVKHNPLRGGNPTTASLFIVNPFSARGVVNLFSTHPPMQKRIERLNKMKV
jgi:heat shock protein HtpX